MGKAAFLATQWGLQQVAVAIGPRAEAQEPFSRAQWRGANRLGDMGERWNERESSPRGKGKGFQAGILPLLLIS